jgi:hypothetical protein
MAGILTPAHVFVKKKKENLIKYCKAAKNVVLTVQKV